MELLGWYQQIVASDLFSMVEVRSDIPDPEELSGHDISLPVCIVFPPKEVGGDIDARNRVKQDIACDFEILLIAESGNATLTNELPIIELKNQLRNHLIGFTFSGIYTPMRLLQGGVEAMNTKHTYWLERYRTTLNYKPQ